MQGTSGCEGASHLATQVVRCQGRVSYVEACCARGRPWRRNGGGIGAEDRYGAEEPDANPHPEAEPTLQSRHPELLLGVSGPTLVETVTRKKTCCYRTVGESNGHQRLMWGGLQYKDARGMTLNGHCDALSLSFPMIVRT